jgi:gas vesicle protein
MKPVHFLVSIAAGAAVGLLFAPKPGAKSRAYLANKAREGADYAKRSAGEAVEYVQRQGDTFMNNASGAVERVKTTAMQEIENALDAGKQAYKDAVSDRA